MKYSLEEKLRIIQQIEEGFPLKTLSRKLGIDNKMVKTWLLRYKTYGLDGLKLKKSKQISLKEKEKIVLEHTEKGVPLQKLSHQYDISLSSLCVWIRLYRIKGTLSKQKAQTKMMSRSKTKEPETELEKLQAENLRLRAENALLKKVRALVLEEKLRAQHNGQLPSKN